MVGQDVVLGLRRDLFDHLTTLSLRYFSQQKAGWIIARLTSDVDALSDVLSQGLTTLVVNTLTLLAAVVGLFILDWRLGLVALVILPPTLVLTRWFQVRSHAAFLRVRETISSMTAQIAESISGMAVIQAFNRERTFLAEFDEANDANRRTNTHAQYLNSLFFPGIELLGAIAMVSVLWVGGRMMAEGSLSIGTLVSAVFLLNLIFQPLQELSDLYGQVQSAGAAMEKITTVLDEEAEIHDEPGVGAGAADRRRPAHRPRDVRLRPRAGAARDRHPRAARRLPRARRRVGRRQVDDGEARRPLLRPRRRRDPASTATTCATLELRSYRRQLGVVLQDPFLFAGTIADNIRFARPEATDDEVARRRAAPSASTRIARRFDEGLQHEVREGGAGLSAGERQLISIARALLADPRILIFDEATSNIDRPTEILIERRSTGCCAAGRRSSSPTALRPSGARTRSSSWSTAASRSGAASTSCSPPTARSAASRPSWRARSSAAGGLAGGAGRPAAARAARRASRAPSPSSGRRTARRCRAGASRPPRAASRAPASVSFAYETRASEAQVCLADVAGTLEALEQPRDPRRGQQDALGEVDAAHIPPSA